VAGTTYYFWSNGAVTTTSTPPAGTTLVGTTALTAANALHTCEAAGPLSPLFPTSRSWEQTQESRNQAASLGLRRDFGTVKLDAAYTYVNGTTTTSYVYNAAALIGSGFPEARFRQDTLEANLSYAISKTMGIRAYYRYERGKVRDWHYDGVAQNPVPATNAAYLDTGPAGDYDASTLGVFLRIDF
jgi:predicted porin